MPILVFNYIGIGIAAAAFGVAYLAGKPLGIVGEGELMVMAGPLIVVADLAYRLKYASANFRHPDKGGMLLFLPVWVLGGLWTVLGAYYMLTAAGPQPAAK